MKQNKKIVALVVTYNRKELLVENIQALKSQSHSDFDILIIDNASTDGTEEYIKEYLKDNGKYINTGKNLGGAGGFSLGIKKALENDYDYAWLMDDDTVPTENALESLISKATLLNDKFSFLGSLVKWTDGKLCIMNAQDLSKTWYNEFDKMYNGLIPVVASSFVSMFINLKDAREVGIPIEKFFIYGDDWEYSERLKTKKPCYLDIDSIVIHKMRSNIGTDIVDVDKERIDRYYFNYRNLFYIYKKYYTKKDIIKYILKYFYTLLKILVKSKNKRIKRMYIMTKGMISGLIFNPDIEYVK